MAWRSAAVVYLLSSIWCAGVRAEGNACISSSVNTIALWCGRGLLVSRDDGAHWMQIGQNIEHAGVDSDGTVYALLANQNALLSNTEFETATHALPEGPIGALVVADGRVFVLASREEERTEVFVTTDRGVTWTSAANLTLRPGEILVPQPQRAEHIAFYQPIGMSCVGIIGVNRATLDHGSHASSSVVWAAGENCLRNGGPRCFVDPFFPGAYSTLFAVRAQELVTIRPRNRFTSVGLHVTDDSAATLQIAHNGRINLAVMDGRLYALGTTARLLNTSAPRVSALHVDARGRAWGYEELGTQRIVWRFSRTEGWTRIDSR